MYARQPTFKRALSSLRSTQPSQVRIEETSLRAEVGGVIAKCSVGRVKGRWR
jgi:hypothetical protein